MKKIFLLNLLLLIPSIAFTTEVERKESKVVFTVLSQDELKKQLNEEGFDDFMTITRIHEELGGKVFDDAKVLFDILCDFEKITRQVCLSIGVKPELTDEKKKKLADILLNNQTEKFFNELKKRQIPGVRFD